MKLSEEYKRRIQKLSGQLNEDASIGPNGELEDFDTESPKNFLYDPIVDKIFKMVYGMTGEKITDMVGEDDEEGLAFETAEAIHQYIIDYNENVSYIHRLQELLRNHNYKSSPLYDSYEDLSEVGKKIYDGLVEFGPQLA